MNDNDFNLIGAIHSYFRWDSMNTAFNNCLWLINKLLAPFGSSNFVNYALTISWSILLSKASFAFLLISMVSYWLQITFKLNKKTFFGRIPSLLMYAANITLAFLLLVRWIESGHFPLSNLYESLLFLSWGLTSMHLFLENTLDKKETRVSSSTSEDGTPATISTCPSSQYSAEKEAILPFSPLATLTTITSIPTISNFGLPEGTNATNGGTSGTVQVEQLIEVANGGNVLLLGANDDKVQNRALLHDQRIVPALTLGAITSPLSLFTNAFATFSLPQEMQRATVLVPALQSNWLIMHVSVMIISYAALLSGSLLAIAFLVSQFVENTLFLRNTCNNCIVPPVPTKDCLKTQMMVEVANDGKVSHSEVKGQVENGNDGQQSSTIFNNTVKNWTFLGEKNLPHMLDNLSYRSIGLGFAFLTIGILSGAVWANEAWGSYWSWDPKETWAFVTWLVFAFYLHTRLSQGWVGKKSAYVAIFGFLVIWFCYLGVNLVGKGLHSYGWFQKVH